MTAKTNKGGTKRDDMKKKADRQGKPGHSRCRFDGSFQYATMLLILSRSMSSPSPRSLSSPRSMSLLLSRPLCLCHTHTHKDSKKYSTQA